MSRSFLELIKQYTTEGIFLASAPVVVSLMTYLYERGYISFYGAPTDLIQLDINRLLIATGVLATAIILFSLPLAKAADLARGTHPFMRALGRSLLIALALLPIVVMNFEVTNQLFWFIAAVVVLLLAELVPPIFKKRGAEVKYWDGVAAAEMDKRRRIRELQDKTLTGFIQRLLNGPIFFFLIFAMFMGGSGKICS